MAETVRHLLRHRSRARRGPGWPWLGLALLLCLLLGIQDGWAKVVVLRDHAKRPVASRSRSAPERPGRAASGSLVVLGQRNSIAQVKRRPLGYTLKRVYHRVRRRLSAKSAIVLDAATGQTLFALAPDTPRQPASTIKVLTASIALQSLDRRELVPVSRYAAKMPRSKIYLDPKKRYPATELIDAVLLASANDASVALAEAIAGNEAAFADLMTMKARLWGARHTVCRSATGLTRRGQYSTARDLANIFRHAMQDEEFAARMRKRRRRTSFGTVLYNHNKALWRIPGAVGGKTGYTNAARQTYVGMFQRNGDTIVVAIMGSESMWSDVRRLVEYGFKKKEVIRIAAARQARNQRLARAEEDVEGR